jgi:two-component system sensor histidine kinase QseC
LRAGRILSQLLDLARAQRHGGPSEAEHPPAALDLAEVAAQLVAEHAPQGHASGHELSLLSPAEPVRVHAAPMLVELALRNLIANALRHTPPDTQIVVAVWRSSDAQGVSVSDDGQRPGAAPPHVSSDGLGLGLRLVERLAEQMGARLERSAGTAPMTTCFSLRWPR